MLKADVKRRITHVLSREYFADNILIVQYTTFNVTLNKMRKSH